MSDRQRALLRQLAAAARHRDEAPPAFLDGLLIGAMVGAAIAGSTLWSRWRARRSHPSGARAGRSNVSRSQVRARPSLSGEQPASPP